MKFNILSMALDPEIGNRLDDAYFHDWDSDVYSIFHEAAHWHEAFADEFEITKLMMEELTKRLDEAWDLGRGTAPTFYELEDIYETRQGGGDWERYSLISAMRYLALCRGRFDKKFFEQVTRDHQAPAEANAFARPMDRESEIYFI